MALKEHFQNCYNNKRAIIAFNIQNLDQLYILSEVVKKLHLPVLAQFSQKYIPEFEKVIGLAYLAKKYQTEFLSFHLDHCMNMDVSEIAEKVTGAVEMDPCYESKETIETIIRGSI